MEERHGRDGQAVLRAGAAVPFHLLPRHAVIVIQAGYWRGNKYDRILRC